MLLKALGVALGASILGTSALAHHSTAMFDQSKVISRRGTIKQLEWINPHVWLHVTMTDESGREAVWSFEAGSPLQLTQLGWKPEGFRAGATIEVGFRPMRDGSGAGS